MIKTTENFLFYCFLKSGVRSPLLLYRNWRCILKNRCPPLISTYNLSLVTKLKFRQRWACLTRCYISCVIFDTGGCWAISRCGSTRASLRWWRRRSSPSSSSPSLSTRASGASQVRQIPYFIIHLLFIARGRGGPHRSAVARTSWRPKPLFSSAAPLHEACLYDILYENGYNFYSTLYFLLYSI